MEKIFIPVHLPGHWTLCVIEPQVQKISLYDSFLQAKYYEAYHEEVLQNLLLWLKCEQDDQILNDEYKMGTEHNWEAWSLAVIQTCPQQEPGSNDCGVFTILAADYLTDDLPLNYTASEGSAWRAKIAAYIIFFQNLPYRL